MIKELAKKLEREFNCLGENTEKYKTVLIKKEEKRISTNEEIKKNISCKLKLVENVRFMASLLLNLVDKLAEGIHKVKFKYWHDNKKCEECGIKCKYCKCYLK